MESEKITIVEKGHLSVVMSIPIQFTVNGINEVYIGDDGNEYREPDVEYGVDEALNCNPLIRSRIKQLETEGWHINEVSCDSYNDGYYRTQNRKK